MPNIAIVQSVSDLPRAKTPLRLVSAQEAVEALLRRSVEACSDVPGKIVPAHFHPLMSAIHYAFCDHRPLVLSPDMLWLLVAQGFARHVNNNENSMRGHFVATSEKAAIVVRRDDFRKGSPDNPWPELFDEFSLRIRELIGEEMHDNLVASFSTTGPIEKAAAQIVLMHTLESYLDYAMETWCGIPEVTLEGQAEDWDALRQRTAELGKAYGLQEWTDRMAPTLDRVARNAAGEDDPGLWKDIYKLEQESGGPYIDGWILDFFPYLQIDDWGRREGVPIDNERIVEFMRTDRSMTKMTDVPNWRYADPPSERVTLANLPGGLCQVPLLWEYLGREYPMQLIAGFIGYTQCETSLAVRPEIGWAVADAPAKDNSSA